MHERIRHRVEKEGQQERGLDVEVRFTFVRHSQKKTGHVIEEGGGLSTANLSDGGRKRASDWGAQFLKDRIFNKAYATASDRTRETLQDALAGGGVEAKILQSGNQERTFFELPALEASEAFMNEYVRRMDAERDQILASEFNGKDIAELSPDEQESVMERAEEPAIAWYLSFGNTKPDDETPSPVEQAQAVAWKMNRLSQLADNVEAGKHIDLLSSGHKTSTEAFLQEMLRESGVSLDEVGGSMKILDGWDFVTKVDANGAKSITLILRREDGSTHQVDVPESAVKSLAHEFIQTAGKEHKKADG